MTNEEILEKAIKKAIENGYPWNTNWDILRVCEEGVFYKRDHGYYAWINDIIFSHDFAKAFWGEGLYSGKSHSRSIVWKYHLQIMVLEKEPLKYLEKFL